MSSLALSTGREVAAAWLGFRRRRGDALALVALKPVILTASRSSGAYVEVEGDSLLTLERLAEDAGEDLTVVVLAHTHNWPGGHEVFSSRDRSTARELANPQLAFAVIDPYTKAVSHWRWLNGAVERIEYRVVNDEVALLKDGELLPLLSGYRPLEERVGELEAAVKQLDEALKLLGEALRSVSRAVEELKREADAVIFVHAPDLEKRRSALSRILRALRAGEDAK